MLITRLCHRLSRQWRARRDASLIGRHFNKSWYLSSNPDVKAKGLDPIKHYLEHGWKEGLDPTPSFSSSNYLKSNDDVAAQGVNPFTHFIRFGLKEGRHTAHDGQARQEFPKKLCKLTYDRAFHAIQDLTFPPAAEQTENLFIIVIPEHNEMSGGIYSFFSIAKTVYNLRFKHDYKVILMTRPNVHDVTFTRQRNFRNSEDVFRFEQITRCLKARSVYIHIPEYAAPDFVKSLCPKVLQYLKTREKLYVNILNQKIDIMPKREDFNDLRAIADEVTQSVAHHAYFSQAFADRYDLPTLLLPAYTDLSDYAPIPFEDKEKLIIYSPDDAPWRDEVLDLLRRDLPDYKLREIRGITFDEFMDLATRCRFSITFGEGFDGYLAQPIHQGGVSFAVYNDEFFPSPDMKEFTNLFESPKDFIKNIVSTIKELESSPPVYNSVNRRMIQVYDGLYSREEYVQRVLMLVKRNFEYYPMHISSIVASGRL